MKHQLQKLAEKQRMEQEAFYWLVRGLLANRSEAQAIAEGADLRALAARGIATYDHAKANRLIMAHFTVLEGAALRKRAEDLLAANPDTCNVQELLSAAGHCMIGSNMPTKQPFAEDQSAVSPVIGVILMVAITVAMAALVVVKVSELGDIGTETPGIQFNRDGDDLVVYRSDNGLEWANFTVTGCTAPTGTVDAGDRLTECSGEVTVKHNASNTLVYGGNFE